MSSLHLYRHGLYPWIKHLSILTVHLLLQSQHPPASNDHSIPVSSRWSKQLNAFVSLRIHTPPLSFERHTIHILHMVLQIQQHRHCPYQSNTAPSPHPVFRSPARINRSINLGMSDQERWVAVGISIQADVGSGVAAVINRSWREGHRKLFEDLNGARRSAWQDQWICLGCDG